MGDFPVSDKGGSKEKPLTVVEGTNVITGHNRNKGHKCNNIWSQM